VRPRQDYRRGCAGNRELGEFVEHCRVIPPTDLGTASITRKSLKVSKGRLGDRWTGTEWRATLERLGDRVYSAGSLL